MLDLQPNAPGEEYLAPDPRIIAALQREVARRIGKQWAKHFDIRWEPVRQLLCIYQQSKDGVWSIWDEIKDEEGLPRQADMRDVERVVTNRYGFAEASDKWYQNFRERQERRKTQAAVEKRERWEKAAEAMVRVHKYGFRPSVYVHEDLRQEVVEQHGEIKVTDKRRQFEEAS